MLITRKQIEQLYATLEKYPDATEVVIETRENSSGIGPNDIAIFQDRGNIFRQIAPKVFGEEDITDVSLW